MAGPVFVSPGRQRPDQGWEGFRRPCRSKDGKAGVGPAGSGRSLPMAREGFGGFPSDWPSRISLWDVPSKGKERLSYPGRSEMPAPRAWR
jgi:hypothetical protein